MLNVWKQHRKRSFLLIILILFMIFAGCATEPVTDNGYISHAEVPSENETVSPDNDTPSEKKEDLPPPEEILPSSVEGELTVHFIDVGQGDATLIITPSGRALWVDAGDTTQGNHLVQYLKALEISHIDAIVATHPHADHIGGFPDIIRSFTIGKVIMPKVSHTTQTFERLLLAIQEKGLKVTWAKAGLPLDIDPEVGITFIGPHSDSYSNLNDYSASLRLTHGLNALVITGDAEETSETEMVRSGMDLAANLLKVPHHGSSSSTTTPFLDKVSPIYAVISSGHDNSYGHPHQEVLQRLQSRGVEIYRTDQQGTIIAVSDGTDWVFDTMPVTSFAQEWIEEEVKESTSSAVDAGDERGYVGNKNSSIFHSHDCSSLPTEHNRIYFDTREEAIEAGQRPCQRCKP